MPDIIKKISIIGDSVRDIGAEAQNIKVSYNASGSIISDITAPGVVVDHTENLSDVIGAPGDGIKVQNGRMSVDFGATAGKVTEGNDARLSDARKNPYAVTFSDNGDVPVTKDYDGSSPLSISYGDVGAAPADHSSANTTYGVATKDNYGHVKVGAGIKVNNGVISLDGSSNGHTIVNSSTLPMAGRLNLQFGSEYDPVYIEDDEANDKTLVHGQIFICDSESDWNTLSDADFKAKYGANREQVGVYWYLPWANNIAYATDLNPVGTVLSCAVDTTNTTIFPADLVEFPNKDYVICRGATVKISDYPLLYQYFEDEYGDGNYFGTAQTAEGYFVLPNWSADFPTNGVLVIKARITSDVITFAEVDQTGESARTDEVPNCARVAEIESKAISQNVAFTFSTGMSDVNNRTRLIRHGDTITAYICAKYNQNITDANSYPVLSFDESLVPITAVFTVAEMLGTIFQLNVNESDHTIRIAKIVGNNYEANKGIYGQISWTIGK